METRIPLLSIIVLILLYNLTKEKNYNVFIFQNNISEITLLLKGSGNQYVLYQNFDPLPDEVYLNGNQTNFIGNKPMIHLENELNIISLKWYTKITSCYSMFIYRSNIIEIDLSKFDSSSVVSMNYMFMNCSSLKSINFTNFNTSQVTTSCSMFNGCSSLTSLDLSSFNTSKNDNMGHLFHECSSLLFLNLSNFDTSKVSAMDNMFKGCTSLISLDLSNFVFSSINNIKTMFSSCNKLEYVNLNNSIYFVKHASNSKIFEESAQNLVICINNSHLDINPKGGCRSIDCSEDWKRNQKKIDSESLQCVPEDQCNLTTNKYEYDKKCYNQCPNNTYPIDFICHENNFQTTIISFSTEIVEEVQQSTNNIDFYLESSFVIIDTIIDTPFIENINKNVCDIISFFNNICKHNFQTREEQKKFSKEVIQKIMDGTLNGILTKIINENKNIVVEEDDEIYQITTLSNIKDIKNLTSINFGYCENILKSKYGLDEKKELIIYKIDHQKEGYKIPIIEYVVFNENGTIKLNLDYCNNISIEHNIPVEINENDLDKYNSESSYYNDECNKVKSEDGFDMTIYDRKNEFNEKNMSLCEFNCSYRGYDSNTSKVKCKCPPKNGIGTSEGKEDLNKLEANKKPTNFGVTQCPNVFKDKEDLATNSGFLTLLLILAFFLIIFIIFCTRGKRALIYKIDEIIEKKVKNSKKEIKEKNETKKAKKTLVKNKKKNREIKISNRTKRTKNNKNKQNINYTTNIINYNNINGTSSIKGISSKFNSKTRSKNIINEKFSGKLNDYELNSMNYSDAFNFDKRTYCEYYLSLIKTKQMLIFSFCTIDDYNSGVIKKYILFLSFAFHFTSSAVFFNDKTMHQIVKDKGSYNFTYHLRFIIFSALISNFCLRIFLMLIKTEKEIVKIKYEQNTKILNDQRQKIIKCINIKYSIFFILNVILLSLFWYYLTCFVALYQNTQLHLIKNTLISFGLSLFYPFIINILPGVLRINSLNKEKCKNTLNKNKKGDKEYMYKVSKFFQLL